MTPMDNRGAVAASIMIAAAVVIVVAAVLVVTQLDKWTCAPPGGVWVEGPDHCMELP